MKKLLTITAIFAATGLTSPTFAHDSNLSKHEIEAEITQNLALFYSQLPLIDLTNTIVENIASVTLNNPPQIAVATIPSVRSTEAEKIAE